VISDLRFQIADWRNSLRFLQSEICDLQSSITRIEMPDWKQESKRRLAELKLAPTREAEIVEELAQHLGDRYHELLAGGAN
jgi:chromosome segregation ATPase